MRLADYASRLSAGHGAGFHTGSGIGPGIGSGIGTGVGTDIGTGIGTGVGPLSMHIEMTIFSLEILRDEGRGRIIQSLSRQIRMDTDVDRRTLLL